MLNWLLDRIKEKSTWGSIFTLLITATGVVLSPELKEAIMTVGIAVAGLIGIIVAEKPKE